jgi:hypothetical protein
MDFRLLTLALTSGPPSRLSCLLYGRMFEAKLDGVLNGLLTDAACIDISVEFTPNLPLSDLPQGSSNSRSLFALAGRIAEK